MKKNLPVILVSTLFVFILISDGYAIKPKKGLQMAVWMADSEMKRFPDASTVDFDPVGRWNYTPGLIALAMVRLTETTGHEGYYNYAKAYADKYIGADGQIRGYQVSEYNIDKVNSGKFLFDLYQKTGDEKYKKAIEILRTQLLDHPRTSEGGFWHKNVYPSQMWLDGLYMGAPFYAAYAREFNQPELFDDVIKQFTIVNQHTLDKTTGLNYHGWDESRSQKWADTVTGCSPNFWGRAMGWYSMALVDVLDFIPENHPQRARILTILQQVVFAIQKYQEPNSGLWYQVLDQGSRQGNYLESSASAMFVYTLMKAARLGYINKKYRKIAIKGYKGILKEFVKKEEDGSVSYTKTCSVAGLGGNPYRNGSFEYYIGEQVRNNDPKGVGPFILASLEVAKMK